MNNHKEKAWRNDAFAKVTGQAKFANDYYFNEMLYAVPVYSDYTYADIEDIDISKAKIAEGVIKILTSNDIPGVKLYGQVNQDLPLLAYKTIRYNGEPVALVIAKTTQQAINASKLIEIRAKLLEPVYDYKKALDKNSPLVHSQKQSNLICKHVILPNNLKIKKQVKFKNYKILYKENSFHTIKASFKTQKVEHAYLEPEACVCVPNDRGIIEVYGSMQHPFSTRRFIANYLNLPLNMLEIKSVFTGGGFGGKDDTAALVCARAALCAFLVKKPVKISYTREWSIKESYKRHPYTLDYKIILSKDGLIKKVNCNILADGGAYTSVTPWVTWRSTVQCCGPYKVKNVKCITKSVFTNTVFTGAFRGFGSPQVNFAIEQLVEICAEKIGMCEIEFRKKNMLKQGDKTITNQKLGFDSTGNELTHKVNLDTVLDKIINESNYFEKKKQCSYGISKKDNELYGIGLALSYRGMSLGAEGKDFCSAIINVQFDGSVLIETGIHENGQGGESAMINILANELGLKRDKIIYKRSSTSNIPDGGTTVASRGTLMGGGALVKAIQNLKEIFAENLFDYFASKDLTFSEGMIYSNEKKLSFEDAVTKLFMKQVYPFTFGTFKAPKVSWDEKRGKGNAYFTWVYGCQAVELTVNQKTKKINLLQAWAAHDIGKVINASMLAGQFYGGMLMGMGYSTKEKIIETNGIIQNLNYHNYQIFRTVDIPEMNIYFIESEDKLSPCGAKGIGEPTLELMAPAIGNALYRATGKRFFELPYKLN